MNTNANTYELGMSQTYLTRSSGIKKKAQQVLYAIIPAIQRKRNTIEER